jgi:hypothetical protein
MFVIASSLGSTQRADGGLCISTYAKIPGLQPNEWISVLKLATVWEVTAARKVGIEMLEDYAQDDPIARLIVCSKYDVLPWLVPTVNQLAQRGSHIGFADIERLNSALGTSVATRLALKIGWVRETFVGQKKRALGQYGSTDSSVQHASGYGDGFSNRCGVSLNCSCHQLETKCIGDGYPGGTVEDRAAHDFTFQIWCIFGGSSGDICLDYFGN